ncbi:Coenzyme F420 hydrogenase/dehydrogenase, beta subunit C-terminal domain [Rhodococcus jostii]|uniref:Coenzyme F420 hydrogenase/dehydrogenase, beta subunit C-terminal domain n=1 Tax=Rhodococcus jostii TaxID=132919 RepID=UPI00364E36C7
MTLDKQGFQRPVVEKRSGLSYRSGMEESELFESVCPAVRVVAPDPSGRQFHRIFGSYVSVWQGWAADEETRYAGSSGGVLTALSAWLVSSGQRESVTACGPDADDPRRTRAVVLTEGDDFKVASGSRYAPVSNLLRYDPNAGSVFVGKPCEVSAASRLNSVLGISADKSPILLSFFCAGTPSQWGTNALVERMGDELGVVREVRYRGNGWPGHFTVTSVSGDTAEMSYNESWGEHIGTNIQWRCKLCVDGTGGDSDIAVGDYWFADEEGYPRFDNADGNSVVIARTQRGHALLLAAASQGAVALAPIDLEAVARIQPLQVERKITLVGRLLGRLLMGKRVPYYRGFGLARFALQNLPKNLRAAAGTAKRSRSLGNRRRS